MIIHPFWSNKNKFDLDLKMSKCGDLRWLQIDKALFFEDLVHYSAWPQTPIWLLLSPALICMQQIVHLFWQMASSYIVRLIITAQSLIAEINQWMKSLNEALALVYHRYDSENVWCSTKVSLLTNFISFLTKYWWHNCMNWMHLFEKQVHVQ